MTDIQLPAGAPGRKDEVGGSDLATLAAVAAIVFPMLYFASELVAVPQGSFSATRLALPIGASNRMIARD